jgi:shikimate kinase
MVIFFIGFMGSGKSHEARKLASALDIPCVDLDEEIEKEGGKSIVAIFEKEGEDSFRQLESDILHRLVSNIENTIGKKAVIACGGGTPCFHENMKFMNEKGITIWLNPPVEILVERLRNETEHRPLVKAKEGQSLNGFITLKLKEREQFYSQARFNIRDSEIDTKDLINLINHAKELS